MKTGRTDVQRDNRKTHCLNSTLIGYSSIWLNPGDTFLYREHLEGGKERIRFGRCYGRVKPLVSLGGEKTIWHVLALVASDRMTGAYERWIEPKDVIETVPEKYTNPLIRSWFDEQEYWRDQDKH